MPKIKTGAEGLSDNETPAFTLVVPDSTRHELRRSRKSLNKQLVFVDRDAETSEKPPSKKQAAIDFVLDNTGVERAANLTPNDLQVTPDQAAMVREANRSIAGNDAYGPRSTNIVNSKQAVPPIDLGPINDFHKWHGR